MKSKQRELTQHLIEAIIGVRMLAQLEAETGNQKWTAILPKLDDAIERGIAELRLKP